MGDEGEDSGEALQRLRDDICRLQSEQARKKESRERLLKKLEALKDEVGERKEEVTRIQNSLEYEKRKQSDTTRALESTEERLDEARNDRVRKNCDEILLQRIPKLKPVDEEDGEGEGEMQALKPPEEAKKEEKVHDTVLISYEPWTTRAPGQEELNYQVSYRIHKGTTVEQLHNDCCHYWGCSASNYVLVKEAGGRIEAVLDGIGDLRPVNNEVLDLKETAHLNLCSREGVVEWQDLLEKERRKKKKKPAADKEEEAKKEEKAEEIPTAKKVTREPFVEAFKQWPGIFYLMSLRRRVESQHLLRIKLRDFWIYLLLVVLTSMAFMDRDGPVSFWLTTSVEKHLVTGLQSPRYQVTDFRTISTKDDLWRWVETTFYNEVFVKDSALRRFHTPYGFLRIRQQRVKTQTIGKCPRAVVLGKLNRPCMAAKVLDYTRDEKEIIVDPDKWLNLNLTDGGGRGTKDARKWYSAALLDPSNTDRPVFGRIQEEYDTSGYVIDYDLSANRLNVSGPTFAKDLGILRAHWVGQQTRLLVMEMILSNPHLNRYVSSVFVFELPPSGMVETQAIIRPFTAGIDSGSSQTALFDLLRFILVLYILLWKGSKEIQYKMHTGRPGFMYLVSLVGLADAMSVALFFSLFYVRGVKLVNVNPAAATEFMSYTKISYLYETLFIVEGCFLLCILFRITSFLRISRHIFQLWKMFSIALGEYTYFLVLFAPVFVGFVTLAYAIYAPHLDKFSSWSHSLLALMLFVRGDLDLKAMNLRSRVWTGIFMVSFFLVIVCFFVNGFVAIVTHAFWKTRILHGFNPHVYRWNRTQWLDWACIPTCFGCITGEEHSTIKKQKQLRDSAAAANQAAALMEGEGEDEE